ncbi:hypothetical protein K2173_008094 [Erythroxylum novogranatense]|uniref:Uncharacterized protein n=1 Tax=Erythroxylum novogranatense TaxID=1862640 RepID=A0AAV8S9B9_9ROSI|nr:hypothetical protein K2173_008094 [Erythroxylum novogranatense]
MVDTGADTIYMAKELAKKIGLPYKKEKGYVKGVNAKKLPIEGVAHGIAIRISQWQVRHSNQPPTHELLVKWKGLPNVGANSRNKSKPTRR